MQIPECSHLLILTVGSSTGRKCPFSITYLSIYFCIYSVDNAVNELIVQFAVLRPTVQTVPNLREDKIGRAPALLGCHIINGAQRMLCTTMRTRFNSTELQALASQFQISRGYFATSERPAIPLLNITSKLAADE
jgi:hypothetical protein